MRVPALVLLALTLAPAAGWAVPQFAVREARRCDNCHMSPMTWNNPSVELRKCSLGCGSCHVNPTGGGMRDGGGRYFGREILSMFGERPSERPFTPSERASSQPQGDPGPPPPGDPDRYAGMDPYPFAQIGADARLMGYFPQEEGVDSAFFPMQTDVHLALRPINPRALNEGRLTLLATAGFEGSRSEAFDGYVDRFFVKEYWALYHDLPYQLYAKAGRFLPAFGWRLDDHTAFIRQDQSFDNERQVTGVEVGLNPNYLFAHLSVYNPASEWDAPIDGDAGVGAALSAGYRELLWQAGGSVMFESRDDADELWAGAHWSLNLHEATHPWKGLDLVPVIYLGELDLQRKAPTGGEDAVTSLTALHEVDVWLLEGLNVKLRYDWRDRDITLADDHRHRVTFGVEVHPYTFLEIIAQYRINIEPGDASVSNNEALVQVHGWY